VAWDRKTPWRQGKLIATDDCIKFALCSEVEREKILVIVASHDCDLTQSPDIEPNVEVIVGKVVTATDGNLSHAKNVRRLQVSFDGEPQKTGEFEAIRKTSINKTEFIGLEPRKDLTLSPENVTIFQQWLARRYRRSAFPDEFEEKLKSTKLAEKITKAVKPHGEDISALLFDVDAGKEVERPGPDDTYQLDIVILYPAEPDPEKSLKAAAEVQRKIKLAFESELHEPLGKWQHIELRYCEVYSEEALTYKQLQHLKRWRLDHMSLGASPQQAIMAE
jgi:hypothetical protein